MQARSANDHAGDQLAKDRGQLPAHQQFRQASRYKITRSDRLDQGFDHFELVGADLRIAVVSDSRRESRPTGSSP